MKLPIVANLADCPKCGGSESTVQWHSTGKSCQRLYGCPGLGDTAWQHVMVTCMGCGHRRAVQPLDQQEAME